MLLLLLPSCKLTCTSSCCCCCCGPCGQPSTTTHPLLLPLLLLPLLLLPLLLLPLLLLLLTALPMLALLLLAALPLHQLLGHAVSEVLVAAGQPPGAVALQEVLASWSICSYLDVKVGARLAAALALCDMAESTGHSRGVLPCMVQ
jgi:hypothetical protein